MASALTASLARDGQGGMTAVLPMANAGATYTSDPDTGIHRTGANEQALFCGAADILTVDTDGVEVDGDLEVTGEITSNGVAILPVGLGPLPWSGLSAPPKWLFCRGQTLLRADYADLWAFAAAEIALGNTLYTNGNGSTTFTVPDLRGGAPFGLNDGTSRLTTANSGVDGDVMGSVGGLPNPTLLTANLPPYTPAGTNTSGAATFVFNTIGNAATGGATTVVNGITPSGGGNTVATVFTQPTFTGNAQGGTSTPVKTQPRTVITNYIIYAGA